MSQVEKREDPYIVECDDGGCELCGRGQTWTVVGPDAVACSTSWENLDDAESYAADMNAAYWAGKGK